MNLYHRKNIKCNSPAAHATALTQVLSFFLFLSDQPEERFLSQHGEGVNRPSRDRNPVAVAEEVGVGADGDLGFTAQNPENRFDRIFSVGIDRSRLIDPELRLIALGLQFFFNGDLLRRLARLVPAADGQRHQRGVRSPSPSARTSSKIASARSASLRLITSGGMKRMTLCPQPKIKSPFSKQR